MAHETNAIERRDVRELRLLCQRLSKKNEELRSAADADRVEACGSRRRAEAAQQELEAERRSGAELRRIRDTLQVVTAADKRMIKRLQAQLCGGLPSSRLVDRARCLKRAVEKLKGQSDAQAAALSARTADLEGSRREARELAAALGARTGTLSPRRGVHAGASAVEEVLEIGRVKLMNHDLALEMARLSEASEALAKDKQEIQERLWKESAEVKRCQTEIGELREALDRERKEAEVQRAEVSKANASAREARGLADALRTKEKRLIEDLEKAGREFEGKLSALSTAAERAEAAGAQAQSLQVEVQACRTAISTEMRRSEQVSAQLRASDDNLHRTQQRLETLEGVERETQRLEDLLKQEKALQECLRKDLTAAKEELRVAVEERGELLRGLRQAKVYNDELAQGKEKAEKRELEACARCVDVREGKLALQMALLEQLSTSRAELRDERQKRQQMEATLARFGEEAAARSRSRALTASEGNVEGDENGCLSLEDGSEEVVPAAASLCISLRPRGTVVQDYIGEEGAEQFLSDWDEEQSSTSSLLSPSSPPAPPPLIPPPPRPTAVAIHGGSYNDSDCDEGDAGSPLDKSKALLPGAQRPSPSPPLMPTSSQAPEERSAWMGESLSPVLSHVDGTAGRGRGLPAPSLTVRRLNEPALARWASSMVVLGRAAAVGSGEIDGVSHGNSPPAAELPTADCRPLSEGPGGSGLSPGRSRCSGMTPQERRSSSSAARHASNGGNQSHDQPQQQHQGQAQPVATRQAPPRGLDRAPEGRVTGEEGRATGDVQLRRCSPGPAATGGVAAVWTPRSIPPPPPPPPPPPRGGSELSNDSDAYARGSNSGGRSGGGGDTCGGASVNVGLGDGDNTRAGNADRGGDESRASSVGARAGEKSRTVDSVLGAGPRVQQRCSLFDLADQSIDDI